MQRLFIYTHIMSLKNWAHYAIKSLEETGTATITPHGNSMSGMVESGDTVTLVSVPKDVCPSCKGSGTQQERASCTACNGAGEFPQLEDDDIVLVDVKGKTFLHKIVSMDRYDDKYEIGNNKGHINGWVHASSIYGVVTVINGRAVKIIKEPEKIKEPPKNAKAMEAISTIFNELKASTDFKMAEQAMRHLAALKKLFEKWE